MAYRAALPVKARLVDSRSQPAVLSLGYVALDVVMHEQRILHRAGGTASNVAANLAYLGWNSSIAGRIGTDPAGVNLTLDLKDSGVNTSALKMCGDVDTPVVVHEVNARTHRYHFTCPSCGRRFPRHRPVPLPSAYELMCGGAPDVLFFDRASSAALLVADHVRANGGLVFFEPSTLGAFDRFTRAIDLAHVVKFSSERVKGFADHIRPSPRQLQIETLGSRGARWRVGSGRWRRIQALEAPTIIDAGGAGDWMTAAFLDALAGRVPVTVDSIDALEPLQQGQAWAALSCGFVGARGLSKAMPVSQARCMVDELRESKYTQRVPVRDDDARSGQVDSSCGACLAAADT
jgi:fructokinase